MKRRPQDPVEERLSHLAHEFKSPLSGIQSLVSLLKESSEKLTTIQHDQVRLIGAFTDHLELLMENILSHRKLEHSSYTLYEEVLDVGQLVRDILKLKAFAFSTHQIEVVLHEEGVVPLLRCDRVLCTQAILNLLDNALKFTPEHGRILIRLTSTDEGFFINIEDTGPGIKETNRESALKPYTQLHKGEGLGLGLSLVKETMDLHQGTLQLMNRPEGGLIVTLRFDASRCISQTSVSFAS